LATPDGGQQQYGLVQPLDVQVAPLHDGQRS